MHQHRAPTGGRYEVHVAMLQTGAENNPQQVLQSMIKALEAVTQERKVSLMRLQNTFDAEMDKLNSTGAALLAEQTQLKATLTKDRGSKLGGLMMATGGVLRDAHISPTLDQFKDSPRL